MNILFLTPRFPFPTTKGDKLRSYHEIKNLASFGHRIILVAAADEPVSQADLAEMREHCARIEVVPLTGRARLLRFALKAAFGSEPAQVTFYRSRALEAALRRVLAEERPDVIHATLIRVLPYVWPLDAPPVVVDLMDAFERSLENRKAAAHPLVRPLYSLEARRVARYERAACARFPRLAVSAEPDREAIGAANVSVVRSSADLAHFSYSRAGRDPAHLVVTGNMGYQPNVDGVLWFAKTIWPLIRAKRPEVRWSIVGARPAPGIVALGKLEGIDVTGPVPSVPAYLHRATVALCPIRIGSGVQTKVMESFCTGTPTVATVRGNEGIGGTDGKELLLADAPGDFAAAVLRLLEDSDLRETLAHNARAYAEREFDWALHARRFEALYRQALEHPRA